MKSNSALSELYCEQNAVHFQTQIVCLLRILFGLKRDEVTGGWRKLHT
jgi:hypothetical protein